MNAIGSVVTTIAIAANLGIGVAGMVRADQVVANARAVGVSSSTVPILGALKVAGALGLLAGLVGVDALGVAAAAGLVLFFIGAVASHVRARVFHNLAFPGFFLALAVASLLAAVAR